jgi:hypothetical protein
MGVEELCCQVTPGSCSRVLSPERFENACFTKPSNFCMASSMVHLLLKSPRAIIPPRKIETMTRDHTMGLIPVLVPTTTSKSS